MGSHNYSLSYEDGTTRYRHVVLAITTMAKCPTLRQTQARAPPRCHKCSSRPLRSQCIHTVAGRSYLKNVCASVETLHDFIPQKII